MKCILHDFKLFTQRLPSFPFQRKQVVLPRGLHGLKTEARTRPVPEIVWPNPTRAAQLNLEPEPDPKSPPPAVTYILPSLWILYGQEDNSSTVQIMVFFLSVKARYHSVYFKSDIRS